MIWNQNFCYEIILEKIIREFATVWANLAINHFDLTRKIDFSGF